ncbi:PTS sugar transporter subunit IIA [Breznakia pachnodae]|uniref:Glucose-specific phosphotransferase system IIA component n=1 Tax=Breznakia pachnodae TaxID=265178 RepID=A0ABU0E7W6_9FIRM|nr:PTS glucose transporter subunit IIA [Breznakia pachnodae]MDQ0362999.1 glucose-specific phosphotransferase system IIA component [Breznakia pachnodae]
MKIYSPIKGKLKDLSEVNDIAFSQKMLGDGIAIVPYEGKLIAPFDAKVEMIFPSKHAIGLQSTNGKEILIHIGIDTVNLKGNYFESFIKQGDEVKQGDLLIKFDMGRIKEKGYCIDTMIIISNTNNSLITDVVNQEEVLCGDYLMCIE